MNIGYKINIKNFRYTILLKDDETGVEYGPIQKIPGLMELTITPNVLEGKLRGDGAVKNQEVILESLGVAMGLNRLPLKDRAAMRGNKYENGELTENKDDKAPYIAMAFESETTEKPELTWLFKGKMSPPTDEQKQRDGNVTYNTDKVNFLFIPREFDGDLRKIADGNDEDLTPEKITNWFNKVPGTV